MHAVFTDRIENKKWNLIPNVVFGAHEVSCYCPKKTII